MKAPTMDEWVERIGNKIINEFVYNGKTLKDWIDSQELKNKFLNILFEIQEAVWGMDIPSPTVPEYVEHHKQMQELLALIDTKIKEIEA